MGFTQSITSGFANYINFSGRATRSEFWFWYLFTLLGGFLFGFIDGIYIAMSGGTLEESIGVLGTLFTLGTLLPSLAMTARRLHDVNRSGWWMLISFTIIGLIPLLYWYCIRGTYGDNFYGPDPLVKDDNQPSASNPGKNVPIFPRQ
jgi:uncharacterized membrane protein YhaH (DUF805 family)